MPLKEYARRIDAIDGITVKVGRKLWNVNWSTNDDPKIAIKEIRLMQKQLRILKKELNLAIKEISTAYRSAISDTTYKPGLGGAILGPKWRRVSRQVGAATKRQLRDERDRKLAPYRQTKDIIDQALSEMDMAKLRLEIET